MSVTYHLIMQIVDMVSILFDYMRAPSARVTPVRKRCHIRVTVTRVTKRMQNHLTSLTRLEHAFVTLEHRFLGVLKLYRD